MASPQTRLRLYADRYKNADTELIRDINRLLGALDEQLVEVTGRVTALEAQVAALELQVADHESRIVALEP